jgi:hypothetical protein
MPLRIHQRRTAHAIAQALAKPQPSLVIGSQAHGRGNVILPIIRHQIIETDA